MKNLKVLFSVFMFTFLAISCTNDDPLAKVKYKINGFDSSITQIKYNVFGGTVTVADPQDFANGGDSRTQDINVLPFDAKLQVAASNTTASDKTYNLIIYVDGVSKANFNLVVPANSTASGEVLYTVEAD